MTLIVTTQDLRMGRFCAKGSRRFCELHGLDWHQFVREGFPAEVLEATGDAQALMLVEVARKRQREGGE